MQHGGSKRLSAESPGLLALHGAKGLHQGRASTEHAQHHIVACSLDEEAFKHQVMHRNCMTQMCQTRSQLGCREGDTAARWTTHMKVLSKKSRGKGGMLMKTSDESSCTSSSPLGSQIMPRIQVRPGTVTLASGWLGSLPAKFQF